MIKDGIKIQKFAELSEEKIREKISGINFNQKKAQFIREAAIRIREHHKGKFPDTLKELLQFNGVGNKVANIVLQQAFQKNVGIAVDVHVHRIVNRLGWVNTKTPDDTMTALHQYFTPEEYEDVNFNFVGLGQLLCKANDPKCLECPLSKNCKTGAKSVEKVLSSKRKSPLAAVSLVDTSKHQGPPLVTEEENKKPTSPTNRKTRATLSSLSPEKPSPNPNEHLLAHKTTRQRLRSRPPGL